MEIRNIEIKKWFFANLNERQKRHFTAIIATDLGFGGQLLTSKTFNIDADTIRRGSFEIASREELPINRIRKTGGGRKKKLKPNQK